MWVPHIATLQRCPWRHAVNRGTTHRPTCHQHHSPNLPSLAHADSPWCMERDHAYDSKTFHELARYAAGRSRDGEIGEILRRCTRDYARLIWTPESPCRSSTFGQTPHTKAVIWKNFPQLCTALRYFCFVHSLFTPRMDGKSKSRAINSKARSLDVEAQQPRRPRVPRGASLGQAEPEAPRRARGISTSSSIQVLESHTRVA